MLVIMNYKFTGMNRSLLLVAFLILMPSRLFSSSGRVTETYDVVTDYSITFRWNNSLEEWIINGRQEYKYNEDGLLTETLSVDPESSMPLTRTVYNYYSDNKLYNYLHERWDESQWIPVRKYELEYDESGRTIRHFVQDFIEGEWVLNRNQYNYTYEGDLLKSCTYQGLIDGILQDTGTEYYYYNESGLLTGSEAFDMSGNHINRVFYYNNSLGQRTGMLVQGWANRLNDWLDSYRDTYTYNNCGKRILSLRERFDLVSWVPERKTEILYKVNLPSGAKRGKVAICHNGNTIYVSVNALDAHLAHGDCLGECLYEKVQSHEKGYSDEMAGVPFTVFPNPSSGPVTVRFTEYSREAIRRVALTNNYGRILRSSQINGQEELVIPRGDLLNGSYYLRVSGTKVYSIVIIFN